MSVGRIRSRFGHEGGFTLVEVTIILLVLVILSMIMLPQLGNFNRLARKVKVMEDIGALCATMKKFMDEAMVSAIWENPGGATAPPSGDRIGLLHGPGKPPADANGAAFHQVNGPAAPWSVTGPALGNQIDVNTDAPGASSTAMIFAVDRLENHLMVNDPFGDGSVAVTTRYKNTSEDALEAVHFFLSWKGPYFDAISEDPWGQRYLVNVFALHTQATPFQYFTSAVVCYSAGPDGNVQTRFNQPMDNANNSYGWITGGDDFAAILSSGGPF